MVDADALAAWADAVIPAGPGPSARAAGIPERLLHIVGGERPEWGARIDAVLAGTAAHDEPWLARLIAQEYVARPAAWSLVGWAPVPAPIELAGDLPAEVTASVVPRSGLARRYDAVVIGSGAGGGVAAQELAEAGRTVLVVERGHAPATDPLAGDHLRNPRYGSGLDDLTGPPTAGNPRVLADGTVVGPTDHRWGNNAMTLGGGTRVYGAQAWRFAPDDFRMATLYGVPEGSALADWPLAYDDLEPYYAQAERELGVSGAPGDPELEGWRSGPFPLPPLPITEPARVLQAGADALGWRTMPVPMLINSQPYRGRPACVRCAQCPGFACPVGARAGSHNTTLMRAARTGRCTITLGATVTRLRADGGGRIVGVTLRGVDADGPWELDVDADEIVLAAGAIETARLLLASPTDREPHGVGNAHDQVGRHLQAHVYAGALGVFAEEINDLVGPGPAISTHEFRHGVDGIVGGGMLANEFVPTPASALAQLQDAGLVPRTGPDVIPALARLMRRMQRVVGPVHEVTSATSRVTLAHGVTDALGMPVARLEGDVHAEDRRTQAFLSDRAAQWLEAAGATAVVRLDPPGRGPSVGQHQAGTMRMGDDPTRSATDPEGRVWGHANVHVVDGSALVTNGGVNPVLTILANAHRVMAHAVSE